jgi:hypothetical protein
MGVDPVQTKTRPRSDGHASDMSAGVFPTRQHGFDQIAAAEAKVTLLAWDMTARKSVFVRPAHLL